MSEKACPKVFLRNLTRFHFSGANAQHDAAVHAAVAEPRGAEYDDEPGGAGGHQPDTAGTPAPAGSLAGTLQVSDVN